MKQSLRILGCMAAGILAGVGLRCGGVGGIMLPIDLLLCLLLWAVGADMGCAVREMGLGYFRTALRRAVLTLAGTISGTLLGGWLGGWLTGVAWRRAFAVASGFGWYTLSSVVLAGLDTPAVGALAFLCNILREALALLLIPALCRRRRGGMLAAISTAGATSMDTALPLIASQGGDAGAAFVHGLGLSLLVPALVPLYYSLGG